MTLTEDELARPLTAKEEATLRAEAHTNQWRSMPPLVARQRLLATLATARADTAGIDAAWREARMLAGAGAAFRIWPDGIDGEVYVQSERKVAQRRYVRAIGNGVDLLAALLALAAALRTPKPEGEPE